MPTLQTGRGPNHRTPMAVGQKILRVNPRLTNIDSSPTNIVLPQLIQIPLTDKISQMNPSALYNNRHIVLTKHYEEPADQIGRLMLNPISIGVTDD